MAKKKSGWKGGSAKAAVGGYLKKKAGKVWKQFKKETLGIKGKKGK